MFFSSTGLLQQVEEGIRFFFDRPTGLEGFRIFFLSTGLLQQVEEGIRFVLKYWSAQRGGGSWAGYWSAQRGGSWARYWSARGGDNCPPPPPETG